MLPAGAEMNQMSVDSLCGPQIRGAQEVRRCSWNDTALWLSLFVTRGPHVLARWWSLKELTALVFPQAAFKLYMEVSIKLT